MLQSPQEIYTLRCLVKLWRSLSCLKSLESVNANAGLLQSILDVVLVWSAAVEQIMSLSSLPQVLCQRWHKCSRSARRLRLRPQSDRSKWAEHKKQSHYIGAVMNFHSIADSREYGGITKRLRGKSSPRVLRPTPRYLRETIWKLILLTTWDLRKKMEWQHECFAIEHWEQIKIADNS